MFPITIPAPVQDYLDKLDKLVTDYPEAIPIKAVAQFMGKHPDTVREMIRSGTGDFGIGWKHDTRWEFYIPTGQFWLSVMKPVLRGDYHL